MTLSLRTILTVSIMTGATFALTSLPAHADKGGHGNSHHSSHHEEEYEGKHHRSSDHHNNNDGYYIAVPNMVVIGDDDRAVIRSFLSDTHRKSCPPGLAKKHNGCLPPGQAKKYRIGDRLPDDVTYHDLPLDLLRRLGHPPAGYQYVQVDKDVLLVAEATKKVVDAVTLLSAVGR